MIFTPRQYQELIIRFGLDHARGNVFSGMGTGKSVSVIAIYDILRTLGEARRMCVIAPKRVALSTWPAEIEKWHEAFGHLKIAAAVGTPEQRLAAVRSSPDILCINYDSIEWLIEGYGDRWPFDMVAADESTRLKGLRVGTKVSVKGNEFVSGQGAKRARSLADIAHKKVRRWLNLTGSPAPNGIIDLWGQQWFIDGGQRLGRSFTDFERRFFRTFQVEGYTRWEPKGHAQREVEDLMRDCSISIDARDWFPIKEPIESRIMIDLPPKARAAYDRMQSELFAQIEREGLDRVAVEAHSNGGKAGKCLQIANGTVYHEDREWVEVHREKLDALESVLEEANGESVLIRYTHIPDRERILKAFGKRRKPVRFLDAKGEAQRDWDAGKCHLLCHAKSAGHGLNLQLGGRILCDYSQDYDLEHDEQIIERIGPTRQMQAGLDRSVFRRRIVARDTLEETAVLPRLAEKITVQEAFKRAMRKG